MRFNCISYKCSKIREMFPHTCALPWQGVFKRFIDVLAYNINVLNILNLGYSIVCFPWKIYVLWVNVNSFVFSVFLSLSLYILVKKTFLRNLFISFLTKWRCYKTERKLKANVSLENRVLYHVLWQFSIVLL